MMESHLNSCTTNSSSTSSITNFFLSGSDPFESAFSSMVSSPTATVTAISINPPGNANLLMDLINRRFCNSNSNSPSSSPHITPLNSPPHLPGLSTPFPPDPDPGFPLRAARFSPFPNPNPIAVQESRGGLSTPENVELTDSRDNSSISDLIPLPLPNSRKRKSIIPKGIQTPPPSPCVKEAHQVESGISESGAEKRSKAEDGSEKAKTKASSKSSEPPRDYIHVRARRGQATDAHSLAERVRREKITERMKFLQDLVPGCNKVTGKAVMLDEIINYVQSLQRQVEFLSMKLSTVNPTMEEMNMEGVASSSKDVFECHVGSLPHHNLYQKQSNPLESYHEYFHSHPQNMLVHNNGGASNHGSRAGLLARGRNQGALHLQVPLVVDNYSETTANVNATQVSAALWEDDLQSFVQMGFGQNMQRASGNSGHGRGDSNEGGAVKS